MRSESGTCCRGVVGVGVLAAGALAFALLALAAIASPVRAALQFEQRALAPQGDTVQGAVDPTGSLTVAYGRSVTGGAPPAQMFGVDALRIGADGSATEPRALGPDRGQAVSVGDVVVDSSGASLISWFVRGEGALIQRLDADGGVGKVLLREPSAFAPASLVLGAGDSTIAALALRAGGNRLKIATTSIAPGGAVGALREQGKASVPALVGVDGAGRATLAFKRGKRCKLRRLGPGGATIARSGFRCPYFSQATELAVSADGLSTLVDLRTRKVDGDVRGDAIEIVRFRPKLLRRRPYRVKAPVGTELGSPAVATDPITDTPTAAFSQRRLAAGTIDVYTAALGAKGAPDKPRLLTPGKGKANEGRGPEIGFDRGGHGLVLWRQRAGGQESYAAARLARDGTPGQPAEVATGISRSAEPTIAFAPDGRPSVLYEILRSDRSAVRPGLAAATFVPPYALIESGPGPGNPSNRDQPNFEISAQGAGADHGFACRVDGGAFAACQSGAPLGPLADGKHTLEVQTYASADVPTPARRFVVDTRIRDADVTARKKQRQKGKRIKVKVKAGAQERVSVTASGFAAIVRPGKRKQQFGFDDERKSVRAGRQKVLRLKLQTRLYERRIKKALKKGRTIRAPISVTIRDRAGNEVVERRVVRVR